MAEWDQPPQVNRSTIPRARAHAARVQPAVTAPRRSRRAMRMATRAAAK